MKNLTINIALLATFVLPLSNVDGAIVVVAPTLSTNGSVSITEGIIMAVNASGTFSTLVLDDWVSADGAKTNSIISPSFSLSINGGARQSFLAEFYDNIAGTFNGFTPGDGYFFINNGPNVSVGDTISIHAATYTLGMAQDFNPQATQNFNGPVFIAGGSGQRLSNNVLIPEPSALAIATLAVIFLLNRRTGAISQIAEQGGTSNGG